MTLPNVNQVTSRYLFNTDTPPENFVDESIITGRDRADLDVDLAEYMDPTTGPGRFALGSEFSIVDQFFTTGAAYANVGALDEFLNNNGTAYELTKIQMAEFYGLDFFGLNVDNKELADSTNDYAERTYIWGNTSFQLADEVKFVITTDGELRIENFKVQPRPDIQENFDFNGGDLITNLGNNLLENGVDPSGIGKTVFLNFTGTQTSKTYTVEDFNTEQATADSWTTPSRTDLVTAMDSIANNLFNAGITATLDDDRPVVYGTDEGDKFSGTLTLNSP